MNRTLFLATLLSSLALAQGAAVPAAPGQATVAAAPAPAPEVEPAPPSLELSLKGGVHLPQVANPLQTSFDALLKVGWALPFAERRFQLFADVSYTQPQVSVTALDARVPGGSFTSTTTLRDLAVSAGLCIFLLAPSKPLVPYVSAGARFHFLRAETVGSAGGAAFGTHQETDTRVGGVFASGAGLRVGPGRVLAEVVFNYLPVDQRLTGASNASSLSVLLGYGLFL